LEEAEILDAQAVGSHRGTIQAYGYILKLMTRV
jgi:hypothetical protein